MPHSKLLALAATLTCCTLASAQIPSQPSPQPFTWSALQQISVSDLGGPVHVITVDQPAVHHVCRVRAITADHIECARRLHKSTFYRRSQVQAVMDPAYNPVAWPAHIIGASIAAGAVTGACFLGMLGPWGIAAAVPTALFGVLFGGFVAVFDDSSPSPEKTLYNRAAEPLAEAAL